MPKNKMNVCLFLAVFFSPCWVKAQSNLPNDRNKHLIAPQTIISRVFYDFTYLKDKSQPDNLHKEVFQLDLGKTASMFTSYTTMRRDSARQKVSAAQANTDHAVPIDQQTIDALSVSGVSEDQFFTKAGHSNPVVQIQHIATSTYLIKDTVTPVQWTVMDSTKTLQGYVCQKATGESHGRKYIAWFCNDLPFSFGPRRLNGLPGLILEAYDDQREVVYNLNHIESARQDEKLGLPADGINATYKEYNKVFALFMKDPAAFWNKSLGKGATGPVYNGKKIESSGASQKAPPKPIINPIDLK